MIHEGKTCAIYYFSALSFYVVFFLECFADHEKSYDMKKRLESSSSVVVVELIELDGVAFVEKPTDCLPVNDLHLWCLVSMALDDDYVVGEGG